MEVKSLSDMVVEKHQLLLTLGATLEDLRRAAAAHEEEEVAEEAETWKPRQGPAEGGAHPTRPRVQGWPAGEEG